MTTPIFVLILSLCNIGFALWHIADILNRIADALKAKAKAVRKDGDA